MQKLEQITQNQHHDPKFREMRVGNFGYFLADLENKVIHISNLLETDAMRMMDRYTGKDFGDFIVAANKLFEDRAELMSIINAGLLVHSGHFDGTF